MKFLTAAALIAAVWFGYSWLKRPAAQAVIKAPEKYVMSLQNDEKRAAEAAAKMNSAIQGEVKTVEKAVEEAEPK